MKDGVIPDGYKLTEVGVIPCDWEVKHLGEVAPLQRGFDLPNSQLQKGNYPVVYSNGILNYHYQYKVKAPGVITGRSGTIGNVTFINRDYWPHNTSLWVTDFKNNFPIFIFYLYKNIHLEKFSVGSGVPTLNRNDVHDFKIPLPPLPEQKRIAEALSNIDELITALDKLITKKRYLKQGAMQQLLTGKTRLPGFTGAWEVRRLAEECEMITKGTTPTSLGKHFQSNGINFIKIESLGDNGNLIKDKMAFIDIETHYLLRRSQLKENDILVSIAGALGRILMIKKTMLPANINQALSIVRLKINANLNHVYLVYFLKSQNIRQQIESINVQAAQANLSLENINDFLISLPPLPEQKAIAQILTQMDEEIEALENKRDKYKKIKQGMMSVLLTGRIRLM